MIEMKVMGIAIDTATGSPIIVLNDLDNRKALPIWIGSAEASAITHGHPLGYIPSFLMASMINLILKP